MSRYRTLSQITELIIHCAATPNGRVFSAADIDRWHVERDFHRDPKAMAGAGPWQGLGPHASQFSAIGYHYVIQINGVVEVGRRLTETGAHCRGHNTVSIGVCMIGTDKFSAEQWESLKRLVVAEQLDRDKRRLPRLGLHGHREFNAHKTCPGFDVSEWVEGGMQPMEKHVLESA